MDILLYTAFFLAGTIGLTVSAMIISKIENFSENILLSLCLFVLSTVCIYNFYHFNDMLTDNPKIELAQQSFTFLIAPCAYLYTKKVLQPAKEFKWLVSLHFIPMVLSSVYAVSANFWLSDHFFLKTDFYISLISNVLWLFYAYSQCLLVIDNKKVMASLPPDKIVWLKIFSFITMLLFSSLFIQNIAALIVPVNFEIINTSIISSILLISGYTVIFKPSAFFEFYIEVTDK